MRLRSILALLALALLIVSLPAPPAISRARLAAPTLREDEQASPPSPPLPPPAVSTSRVRQQALHARFRPDVIAAPPTATPRRATQNATLSHQPAAAIVLFAPHKTGSTFFTSFLHDVATHLGLCWYTDNAAFMYSPQDHTKCASPSCGHEGPQRRFDSTDRGWGECTTFTGEMLRATRACTSRSGSSLPSACPDQSSGAGKGVLWGALRLPGAMRVACDHLGSPPWQWYVVLHSRHPGDTLVSGYHSFGWTHPPPPRASAEQKRAHAARQAAIRNRTVDEYVLTEASDLRRKYVPYSRLLAAPPANVTLIRSKYEELVVDFPRWLGDLLAPLAPSFSPATLASLRAKLLAKHTKALAPDGKHKRSVAPGRFAAEVGVEAAARLRRENAGWWAELGYQD